MKKFLLLIVVALSCCKMNAQSTFEVNGVIYQEDLSQKDKMAVYVVLKQSNNPADIPGISCYEGNIVIPATVKYDLDTYEVTGIARMAFNGSEKLKSITIEANVKTILGGTIINCQALEFIKLPDSIEEIQVSAMHFTPSLKRIEFGNRLRIIGDGNFVSASLEEVCVPDSVTSIGSSFISCSKLSKIRFGKGLRKLAKDAFAACPLQEVVFTQETPLQSRPGFFEWPYYQDGELVRENGKTIKVADRVIIKVPRGCKENYEKAWGIGLHIIEE